jgi:hypothetical protein
VEEIFGWAKTIGLCRRMRHRGVRRVGWIRTFAVAGYNLGLEPDLGGGDAMPVRPDALAAPALSAGIGNQDPRRGHESRRTDVGPPAGDN